MKDISESVSEDEGEGGRSEEIGESLGLDICFVVREPEDSLV